MKQQIEQYANCDNIHDLPEAFHIWSHGFINPGLVEVFGVTTIPEFYAKAYLETKKNTAFISRLMNNTGRILSIGCGDGGVELDIVEYLLSKGESKFVMTCADLSPILLDRLRKKADLKNLGKYIETIEVDLNLSLPDRRFDMIMANHSLHHIVELEKIFDYLKSHLRDRGIFATNDMIGRNGHMRWPETAAIIKAFWPMLSDSEKWHAQLKRLDDTFTDHDCSSDGFEGIRAQDVLPLILERFHPYKFLGCGGFVDLIVDRGYGRAYDVSKSEDVEWIKFLSRLNDILLDAGCIRPTLMLAYFTKSAEEGWPEKFYRNRRASTAVRLKDPEWVKYYA
ncbi:class I SAM-dependent methyltransferase [Roseiarcus fermentans]|uniref:class I SAM-dependent methyltransferase n=1 Tax=Roseiarcus fermentans TaxID=1473586 RepID=UPI001AECB987|nr:class I SAM-dependent methyltransferase [Roseiarcus fermentans]